MIALAKVEEVQKLLAEGRFSQRQIARLTGVSRATVGSIASGKRVDRAEQMRQRELEWQINRGPVARCGGCGGLVHVPCRLCRIRALKEKERRTAKLRRIAEEASENRAVE